MRDLSPPLRYLAYVAVALLVLLVAAGVGATAGVVFGGGPEWLTSGSGDIEGTMSAKTGEGATSKDTDPETSGEAQYANSEEANPDQNANSPAKKTVFTHTATDANSRGDYTYISDPAIDGDPDAVVLVAESTDRGNAGVHPTITTSVFGTKAPTKRNGLSSTRIEQRYPLGEPSR